MEAWQLFTIRYSNLRRYYSLLPQVKTFEFVWNHLKVNHDRAFVVASIYQTGSAIIIHEVFTELTIVYAFITYRCPVILLGDFNIQTEITHDIHVTELKDLMTSFDMSQHVKEATQNAGCCTDLVVTCAECRVTRVTVSEIGLSDHCLYVRNEQ